MKRGSLIALEGLDGSGKSTQLGFLVASLVAKGHDVVATREPTDGAWGQRIRAMARSGDLVAPEEELRWFMEDRAEHIERVVAPALAAGHTVVTDRYFLSTVAYQGARGLDWRAILAESERRFPIPDLAIVFEIEAQAGLARVAARGGTAEPAFEREDFLVRVAEIFARIDCPYLTRLDASRPPDQVAGDVAAGLGPR